MKRLVEEHADTLDENLPEEVVGRNRLPARASAVAALHFPASLEELDVARRRVVFENRVDDSAASAVTDNFATSPQPLDDAAPPLP